MGVINSGSANQLRDHEGACDAMNNTHAMRRYYFLISLGVIVLDRLTKLWVERAIPLHESIRLIPGFFSFTHIENRGAAFGIFNDSPAPWKIGMLVVFSLVALIVVSRLLWKNSHAASVTGLAGCAGRSSCGSLYGAWPVTQR